MANLNTVPLFPVGAQPGGARIVAPSTSYYGDDEGTQILSQNGAEANSGIFITYAGGRIHSCGNNPETVFRFWINAYGPADEPGYNRLIAERYFPLTTATQTAPLAMLDISDVLEGVVLPAQHKLLVGSSQEGSAGWDVYVLDPRVFGVAPS